VYSRLVAMRDAGMKIEGIPDLPAFRAIMKREMSVDPLDFAGLRAPEDIYLVLGHEDKLVPTVYQEKLYNSFSRPEQGRFPKVNRSAFGHYTTAAKYGIYVARFVSYVKN
jgi:hypothetical protein